eukprot:TRINITY_DN65700_c7_g3_i1.p1 TRINITY_DN65700_c7_g3~~TRINITY_DN65700_c7_g3_i1.p1  ORF type:complete len:613 (-),score=263.34 TRINITY_DN65700_c7_g3_i1:298-2136(-)
MSGSAVANASPKWQEGDKCALCGEEFTFFRRRHHCRRCGKSVCDDHSKGRIEGQRVCDPCAKKKKNDNNNDKKNAVASAAAAKNKKKKPTAVASAAAAKNKKKKQNVNNNNKKPAVIDYETADPDKVYAKNLPAHLSKAMLRFRKQLREKQPHTHVDQFPAGSEWAVAIAWKSFWPPTAAKLVVEQQHFPRTWPELYALVVQHGIANTLARHNYEVVAKSGLERVPLHPLGSTLLNVPSVLKEDRAAIIAAARRAREQGAKASISIAANTFGSDAEAKSAADHSEEQVEGMPSADPEEGAPATSDTASSGGNSIGDQIRAISELIVEYAAEDTKQAEAAGWLVPGVVSGIVACDRDDLQMRLFALVSSNLMLGWLESTMPNGSDADHSFFVSEMFYLQCGLPRLKVCKGTRPTDISLFMVPMQPEMRLARRYEAERSTGTMTVDSMLAICAERLGRPADATKAIADKIKGDWYDKVADLQLVPDEKWAEWQIPGRLMTEIRDVLQGDVFALQHAECSSCRRFPLIGRVWRVWGSMEDVAVIICRQCHAINAPGVRKDMFLYGTSTRFEYLLSIWIASCIQVLNRLLSVPTHRNDETIYVAAKSLSYYNCYRY